MEFNLKKLVRTLANKDLFLVFKDGAERTITTEDLKATLGITGTSSTVDALVTQVATIDSTVAGLVSDIDNINETLDISQDRCIKIIYSFNEVGGDTGGIDTGITLPIRAKITEVYSFTSVTPTSATNTGTIRLESGIMAPIKLTDDILADGSVTGFTDGIPDWTAANMIDVAETSLLFVIENEDLTAGTITYYVFYNEE